MYRLFESGFHFCCHETIDSWSFQWSCRGQDFFLFVLDWKIIKISAGWKRPSPKSLAFPQGICQTIFISSAKATKAPDLFGVDANVKQISAHKTLFAAICMRQVTFSSQQTRKEPGIIWKVLFQGWLWFWLARKLVVVNFRCLDTNSWWISRNTLCHCSHRRPQIQGMPHANP